MSRLPADPTEANIRRGLGASDGQISLIGAIQVNLFDNLIAVTPAADRTSCIAIYNISSNLALFIGPLLAGALAALPAGPNIGLRVAALVFFLSGVMFAR